MNLARRRLRSTGLWKRTILYQLIDRFTTNRTAGTVNGTSSEPLGTLSPSRVVTDAASILSISNRRIKIGSGGTTNDPRLVYNQGFTRISGRTLSIKSYSALGYIVGWSSNSSGTAYTQMEYYNSPLKSLPGFASLTSTSRNGPQWHVFILRSTGMFHFLFSESYTNLTLLHIDRTNTSSPLYPAWLQYVNNTNLGFSDVVIPDSLLIPTAQIIDDFNRSDGVPANGWTDRLGASSISSNKLLFSSLSGGIGLCTRDSSKTNNVTVAKLTRTAGNIGLVVRYTDNDNYIRVFHDGTNVQIIKRVSGVEQSVGSTAIAYSAGADLEIIWNDTLVRVIYNNAEMNQNGYTISDASLQTGTHVGTYSTDLNNTTDDFECYARGSAGEYSNIKSKIVLHQPETLLVFEGDSLTASTYPSQCVGLLGNGYDYYNIGVGGQSLATMISDQSTQMTGLVPTWTKSISILWGGTNDILIGSTDTDVISRWTSYCSAARNAGYLVVILTMLPRVGFGAGQETYRQAVNTWLRANYASIADALVDVAADNRLDDYTDTTYYSGDQTHLNSTGDTIVADLVKAAILALP